MPVLRVVCDGAAGDAPLGAPSRGILQAEPLQRRSGCPTALWSGGAAEQAADKPPERSSQLKTNQTPPSLQHKLRLPPPWRQTGTQGRTGDTMNCASIRRQKKEQRRISESPPPPRPARIRRPHRRHRQPFSPATTADEKGRQLTGRRNLVFIQYSSILLNTFPKITLVI
jgi:hypothetical protein